MLELQLTESVSRCAVNGHNKSQSTRLEPTQFEINCKNWYECLSTEDESDVTSDDESISPLLVPATTWIKIYFLLPMTHRSAQKDKKHCKKQKRVLILANSYGRHGAALLRQNLPSRFTVSAIIKPGAPLSEVTKDLKSLTRNFTNEDYVMVFAGTNDIQNLVSKNSKNLNIDSVTSLSSQTNFVYLGVPYRLDNPTLNSHIDEVNMLCNKEIERVAANNRNMVMYFETLKMSRDEYTKHGLRLNIQGKLKLWSHVARIILDDSRNKQSDRDLGLISESTMNDRDSCNISNNKSGIFLGFSDLSIADTKYKVDLFVEK